MARPKRILIGILVGAGLLLAPVAGAPLAVAGNPCYHGFDVPQLSVASGNQVETQPCAFVPTITVIDAGESVTFRNDGDMPHLVTGANAAWGDRDLQLDAGRAVAYTFAEPGVYPYACTLHPGMSGAIVVGDGGPSLAAAFAAAPVVAPPARGPDPMIVAGIAALALAALALAAVLVATRARARKPVADAAADGTPATPEPVTR